MGGWDGLIRAVEGGAVVRVWVRPASRREGIAGLRTDALVVTVHAPPEGGRANEATRRLLASVLGVPPSAVELVRGQTSRRKEFRIQGLRPEEVRGRLQSLLDGAPDD